MKTTYILTAALLPCLLMASPVFAQDKMVKDAVQDKVEETVKDAVKDKTSDMIKDKMAPDVSIMSDTMTTAKDGTVTATGDPLILETPDAIITATEGEMIMTEGETTLYGKDITSTPKMIKAPAVETDEGMLNKVAPAAEMIEISCPSGTTAQADGTCMITGDYKE